MKKFIGILLILVCVGGAGWLMYAMVTTPSTQIFLVRHAEPLNETDESSLSEAGLQRAHALLHSVGASGLRKIFVSEKLRTRQTAEPVAAAIGVSPVVVLAVATDDLVDSLLANKGKTMLVVGHSNTLPAILEGLGVSETIVITDGEFDNLYVVTLTFWRTSFLRLKYGVPS